MISPKLERSTTTKQGSIVMALTVAEAKKLTRVSADACPYTFQSCVSCSGKGVKIRVGQTKTPYPLIGAPSWEALEEIIMDRVSFLFGSDNAIKGCWSSIHHMY